MKVILVTGTPRSGTKYMSRVFTECFGLDVPHEQWGTDGMSHWYCKNMGLVPAKHEVKVLHQTREPLANISSLTTRTDHIYHPVYYRRGRLAEMGYWYVDWHRGIERWAEKFDQYYRYKVEDVCTGLKELCHFLDEDYSEELRQKVCQVPTDTNTDFKVDTKYAYDKRITWEELKNTDQIAWRRVSEIGKEYGYE